MKRKHTAHAGTLQRLKEQLQYADDITRPGMQLLITATEAEVPPTLLAELMGVSRQTVHRWAHGQKPNRFVVPRIKRVEQVLRNAIRVGDLPMEGATALELVERVRRVFSK